MSAPLRPRATPPAGIDPRVAAAARGDRDAAQALLLELLPRVRNLSRYLVRGDAESDDVAQQALIEIVRSLGSYRGEGKLESWVDRITARVALSHVNRARAERREQTAAAPELHAVTAEGARADEYLARREVVALLDRVPDDQRQAVVLHHVMGMSAPEIAQALSIPFETARSRLRLGMAKLRELYGLGEGADDGR